MGFRRHRPAGANDLQPDQKITARQAPAVTSLPIRKIAVKVVFQSTANITSFRQRIFRNARATGGATFCAFTAGSNLSATGHAVTFDFRQSIADPGVYNVHMRVCTDFACHETDTGPDMTMHATAPGSSRQSGRAFLQDDGIQPCPCKCRNHSPHPRKTTPPNWSPSWPCDDFVNLWPKWALFHFR